MPIIVASGAPNLCEIAKALGTPYYMSKPFTFEALTSMIDRALTEAIPPRPPGLLG